MQDLSQQQQKNILQSEKKKGNLQVLLHLINNIWSEIFKNWEQKIN